MANSLILCNEYLVALNLFAYLGKLSGLSYFMIFKWQMPKAPPLIFIYRCYNAIVGPLMTISVLNKGKGAERGIEKIKTLTTGLLI